MRNKTKSVHQTDQQTCKDISAKPTSNRSSGIRNYFSLPRKKKKVPVMEISDPIQVQGTFSSDHPPLQGKSSISMSDISDLAPPSYQEPTLLNTVSSGTTMSSVLPADQARSSQTGYTCSNSNTPMSYSKFQMKFSAKEEFNSVIIKNEIVFRTKNSTEYDGRCDSGVVLTEPNVYEEDYDVPKSCRTSTENFQSRQPSTYSKDIGGVRHYPFKSKANYVPETVTDEDYDVPVSLRRDVQSAGNDRKVHTQINSYFRANYINNGSSLVIDDSIYDIPKMLINQDYDTSKISCTNSTDLTDSSHYATDDTPRYNRAKDNKNRSPKLIENLKYDPDANTADVADPSHYADYDTPRYHPTKDCERGCTGIVADLDYDTPRSHVDVYSSTPVVIPDINISGHGADVVDGLGPLETKFHFLRKPKRLPDTDDILNVKQLENCVARALYDNAAESPDELPFRKGDLLTVLEQNTGGLEGWWLCSLRGRQGICPGNRLRIVPGCYDTGSGVPAGGAVTPTRPMGGHHDSLPRGGTTPHHTGGLSRTLGSKVVTPKRIGDMYTYDTPRRYPYQTPSLDYDVPPTRGQPVHGTDGSRLSRSSSLRYESPRHIPRSSMEHHDTPLSPHHHDPSMMLYDIPRSQQQVSSLYDSPRPQLAQEPPPAKAGGGPPAKSLIRGVRGGPAMMNSTSAPVCPGIDSDLGQYDVPRPIHDQNLEVPSAPSDRSSGVSIMSCDSTSSSASSLPASESPYLSSIGGSSNRSSLEVQELYDVPPEPRKIGQRPRLPPREGRMAGSEVGHDGSRGGGCGEGVYDVPPQVSRDARAVDEVDSAVNQRISSGSDCSYGSEAETGGGAGLPLEFYSATDMLSKRQQNVHCSLEKLANFNAVTSPTTNPVTDERFEESKVIIDRLKETLQDFIKFSEGSTVNAVRHGNDKLAKTMRKSIEPLTSTYQIVNNTWDCAHTNRSEAMAVIQQLTNITKPLADNVRHLATLIQTNASLLFQRTPSIGQTNQKTLEDVEKTPVQERPTHDCSRKKSDQVENLYANDTFLEDYDYVKLESRENIEREHQQIKESLPCNLRKSYDNLVKQSHFHVNNDHQNSFNAGNTTTAPTKPMEDNSNAAAPLNANDQQVLMFYGNQAELHIQHLNTAIDAFFLTIEENQPPKVFIAHSKFVILSAHKLVFIGDSVHRNVISRDVRTLVLNCSNALCDAMKNTVAAAKVAAIQFPSVAAVQEMVDSFAAISNLAANLRSAICRL